MLTLKQNLLLNSSFFFLTPLIISQAWTFASGRMAREGRRKEGNLWQREVCHHWQKLYLLTSVKMTTLFCNDMVPLSLLASRFDLWGLVLCQQWKPKKLQVCNPRLQSISYSQVFRVPQWPYVLRSLRVTFHNCNWLTLNKIVLEPRIEQFSFCPCTERL